MRFLSAITTVAALAFGVGRQVVVDPAWADRLVTSRAAAAEPAAPVLTPGIRAMVDATGATGDTLQEVTTKGIILSAQGMDIDVTYTPDGKFTAMDGQVTGTWRIDGEKLCTSSNFEPAETCVAYPKDKKSGDSFDLASPQGTATIKIK